MLKKSRSAHLHLTSEFASGKEIRALVIDDTEADRQQLIASLHQKGFEPRFERVGNEGELLERLKAKPWDIIICSQTLASFDPLKALNYCSTIRPDIPFILISESFDEKIIRRALENGCKDYVYKDEPARLILVMLREISVAQNRVKQNILEADLKRAEGKLFQARKIEALGQLTSGVAHDFNNIIAVIMLHAERSLDVLDDSKDQELHRKALRRYLQEIVSAGDRAAQLTSQLLIFSRKEETQQRELALNHITEGMVKMLVRTLPENIELETSLAPDLLPVIGDKIQLEQVIMNLVVNSRDAMAKGGKVRIETRNVSITAKESDELKLPMGQYAMLSVSDTGVGMRPETIRQIFEPFFTTKDAGEGTGLGLSNVNDIMKRHLGAASVSSQPGKGTVFKTFWPQTQAQTTGEIEAMKAGTKPETSLRGHETVLFVEDDEPLRTIVTETVRNYGYKILDASNGAEALALLARRETPVDLVVTDIVMGKMGGRQLAMEISRLYPKTKIVYVSGHTDDVLLKEGFERGELNFVPKPYRAKELLVKIRKVMDEQ